MKATKATPGEPDICPCKCISGECVQIKTKKSRSGLTGCTLTSYKVVCHNCGIQGPWSSYAHKAIRLWEELVS